MQTNPDQIAELTAVQELVDRDLMVTTFNDSGCQIVVFDADTLQLVAANTPAQMVFDAKMRVLQRLQMMDLVPGMSAQKIKRILGAIKQRHNHKAIIRSRRKLDRFSYLEMTVRYVSGRKNSIVIFARDIRETDTTNKHDDLIQNQLNAAIEALADGFILFDADDRLVTCNARYRELYKESGPALISGARHEDILRYGLRNKQFKHAYGSEDNWIAQHIAMYNGENAISEQQLYDGRWLRVVERKTADGGRVGLRSDITKLKNQQDELRRLAQKDDLTGLLNRRGLVRWLKVLSAEVTDQTRLAIFHVDLDRFKSVNDILGHEAGDFVLQHCAQILSMGRASPDAVARVGGDEFIIVKKTGKSDATLLRYAKKLISRLSAPIMYQQQSCTIGASIGVSFVTNENVLDYASALTGADIALNVAKSLGGNEVLAFHPDMRADKIQQNDMAKEVRKGIANDEFEPFFQPQIDTETNQIVGFEALIRWRHPVLGLVPAYQFLPIAQRAGLTDALDNIVMDRACAAIRDLLNWGMENPCVSINLSMGQVSDTQIVARLQSYMKTYDVCADQLRIELLESTLLDDRSSLIVQNVHALIAAGFMVELDDFGTGHAAIATLRKFAVSRIKVDRSFVQDIDTDTELQVITAALIDLARRLGIDALAEGVETGQEQATLQKMGCYHAQGYLHAHPMPLDNLKKWLRARGDV